MYMLINLMESNPSTAATLLAALGGLKDTNHPFPVGPGIIVLVVFITEILIKTFRIAFCCVFL